jgi:outer membrane murein-binding lipoprotein Lpp
MERVTKVCICAFVLGAGLIAGCASTQYGADLNAFGEEAS